MKTLFLVKIKEYGLCYDKKSTLKKNEMFSTISNL